MLSLNGLKNEVIVLYFLTYFHIESYEPKLLEKYHKLIVNKNMFSVIPRHICTPNEFLDLYTLIQLSFKVPFLILNHHKYIY